MKAPQLVIDTNVIIAALRSKRGASAKLLSLIGTGLFDFHLSVPLVLEYEEVMLRQRVTLDLTDDEVSDFIDSLCALAEHHKIHFLWRPFLRDEDDAFVLELAVAARCNYIVTYNVKDFGGVEQFGIRVISPKTFLQMIGVIS
jgi:putative PIN family toxin of toxin-antitoxin system